MSDLLYLDTARLGRMTPAAQRAERALVSLAGQEGPSAYFEQFVRFGFEASPLATQEEHYSGLKHWAGVGELKQTFRALAGHRPDLPLFVAHRAAELMKLAGHLLFTTCRNVLVTDLGWPTYHDILEHEAKRADRRLTRIEVRADVTSGQLSEPELIERVCSAYTRNRCDGLFLSAVSNWGVRLPVERIVRCLEARRRVWFVVVDGAQEFCHVPGRLDAEYCDLYLTGTHKWLGAHHPMGLGFCGRRRSQVVIEMTATDLVAAKVLDDPLLRFSAQLEEGQDRAIETLNLTPLFTARASAHDALQRSAISEQLNNVQAAAALAAEVGWRPMLLDLPLRSGILLLEAERPAVRSVSPDMLRTALRNAGIAATTYEGGLIRLSMPATAFTSAEREHLSRALHTVA
ncbi:Aminotransferase class-V [Gemmata sp. SH-PL17]|uniref:aminotransferase class V-fold PLP-dependent enzyme n=1 Tax=Gemmata sp. SH-PL17 TaxID=1630693 RepID=UPI00078E35CD|nr:aminotransferase class V-fold PLP-dependent enzyme [Gemmata sp. SH-PL17]AMV24036.1 Aminotransferase class-V [Gemmata sp. SH-PL17]